MQALVFCPNGHIFESRRYHFGGNVTNLRLSGNTETCPVCAAISELMDGEFDMVDGTLRLLTAPQITLDRLRSLQTVVRTLRSENLPPEDVAVALDEAVPNLSQSLPANPDQGLLWLGVLLMILSILIQHYDATHQTGGVTPEDIQGIIETVIDHQDDPPPTPPATPPQEPPATPASPPDAPSTPDPAPPAPPTP